MSLRTSMERLELCYCCNELGICSPRALSPRLTDKWSCMVSCPLLPLPSASSARSVQLRMWRDWPTILGAICQSAHADRLPLCAGTVKKKSEVLSNSSKHTLTSSKVVFLKKNLKKKIRHNQIRNQPFWIWPGLPCGTCNPPSSWQKPFCECSV